MSENSKQPDQGSNRNVANQPRTDGAAPIREPAAPLGKSPAPKDPSKPAESMPTTQGQQNPSKQADSMQNRPVSSVTGANATTAAPAPDTRGNRTAETKLPAVEKNSDTFGGSKDSEGSKELPGTEKSENNPAARSATVRGKE